MPLLYHRNLYQLDFEHPWNAFTGEKLSFNPNFQGCKVQLSDFLDAFESLRGGSVCGRPLIGEFLQTLLC